MYIVIERTDKIRVRKYKSLDAINKQYGLDLKDDDEYPYVELLEDYIIIDRI